jgi:hypothetical protein
MQKRTAAGPEPLGFRGRPVVVCSTCLSARRQVYCRREAPAAFRLRSEAVANPGADHQRVQRGMRLYRCAQCVDVGVGVQKDLLDVEVGKPVSGKIIVHPGLQCRTYAVPTLK